MIGKIRLEYEELRIRDIILYIYIGLSVAAIYANKVEEKYILEEEKHNPEISHNIRLIVFSIFVLIYIYFLIVAIKKYREEQSKNNAIALIASILFLIGGCLVLYLESQSVTDEEIAL